MRAHKVMAGLVGIAAIVAGAVAIARSSTDTNISSFAKTQPLAATCPKLDWPYGCKWRQQIKFGCQALVIRKKQQRRFSMSGATAKRR
jgi:hypothetical protein